MTCRPSSSRQTPFLDGADRRGVAGHRGRGPSHQRLVAGGVQDGAQGRPYHRGGATGHRQDDRKCHGRGSRDGWRARRRVGGAARRWPVIGAGAIALGVRGAVAGDAVGDQLDDTLSHGLPTDELYVYRDALQKGRSIVIVMVEDDAQATQVRQLIAGLGAESVDGAREAWWIGLRDAEEAEYTRQGGDFRKDELPSGRPPGAGRGRALPAQRARPQRRRLRPPPGRGDPRCRRKRWI
jgi:hypothetical protein